MEGSGAKRLYVRDVFAEVNPKGLTLLAETAVAVEELDKAVLAGEIKDIEEGVADAKDAAKRDKPARRLEQLKALQEALAH